MVGFACLRSGNIHSNCEQVYWFLGRQHSSRLHHSKVIETKTCLGLIHTFKSFVVTFHVSLRSRSTALTKLSRNFRPGRVKELATCTRECIHAFHLGERTGQSRTVTRILLTHCFGFFRIFRVNHVALCHPLNFLSLNAHEKKNF